MNSRTQRARRPFGIEGLEGRLALSGGLASVAHVEHARGHAEVEKHKGDKAEIHARGADDAPGHDAHDDKGHDAHDDKGHDAHDDKGHDGHK